MIQLPHIVLIVLGGLLGLSMILCAIVFIATYYERRKVSSSANSITSSFTYKTSMYNQVSPNVTWENDEEAFEQAILQPATAILETGYSDVDTENHSDSRETPWGKSNNLFHIASPQSLDGMDAIHRSGSQESKEMKRNIGLFCNHIAPTPNRPSPILHFDACMNNNDAPWIVTSEYRIILKKESNPMHQPRRTIQQLECSSEYELSSIA